MRSIRPVSCPSQERRYILDCPVVSNAPVAPDHYRMRLHGPAIACAAVPGQFCMLEVSETLYPFLRRPMCFERILPEDFDILYKVSGEGTRLLSKMTPGMLVSVQGPLGNGFPVDPRYDRHILVAGGIGVAALPSLAEALVRRCPVPPEVILAARSKDALIGAEDFRALGCPVHLATDDGSAGARALASEMVERLEPKLGDRIYACGPMPMMKAIARIAAASGADCLVSLEAQMACGDGACLGCVVESKEEREGEKMVRVCVDGPVFDAQTIDWEAIRFSDDD